MVRIVFQRYLFYTECEKRSDRGRPFQPVEPAWTDYPKIRGLLRGHQGQFGNMESPMAKFNRRDFLQISAAVLGWATLGELLAACGRGDLRDGPADRLISISEQDCDTDSELYSNVDSNCCADCDTSQPA